MFKNSIWDIWFSDSMITFWVLSNRHNTVNDHDINKLCMNNTKLNDKLQVLQPTNIYYSKVNYEYW